MRYAHILMAVASEIWAMHPDKLAAMIDFLSLQADGMKFSAEEIEARIAPQTAAAVARREGSVAVLPVQGVIGSRMNLMSSISGGTSAEQLGQAFDALAADEAVKAIVLDVNSPGGAAQGIDELSAKIAAARGGKPIVAQVDPTAASAAYWIASAADEVAVTPSGWVGSIGAMTAHQDVSAALEKLGVKKTVITSAPYKSEAASHLPLSEEAQAHLQSLVDSVGGMFEDRVASNRVVSRELIRSNYGQGRMVLAQQAQRQGMVDRIATMGETLKRFGASASPAKKTFAAQREKRALQLI